MSPKQIFVLNSTFRVYKTLKVGLVLLLTFTLNINTLAQWKHRQRKVICEAASDQNWAKADRQVKKLVKKWGKLDTSLGYPDYSKAMDSIAMLFRSLPCVRDSYGDFCQDKISIWPGWTTIGVSFRTTEGIIDRCYTIQQGKPRSFSLKGLFLIPLGAKEKLVYKGSSLCEGFVETERERCQHL